MLIAICGVSSARESVYAAHLRAYLDNRSIPARVQSFAPAAGSEISLSAEIARSCSRQTICDLESAQRYSEFWKCRTAREMFLRIGGVVIFEDYFYSDFAKAFTHGVDMTLIERILSVTREPDLAVFVEAADLVPEQHVAELNLLREGYRKCLPANCIEVEGDEDVGSSIARIADRIQRILGNRDVPERRQRVR